MTNLSELWKKGELSNGWYYVQLKEGVYTDGVKSIIMDYYTEFFDFMKHPYLIEEVLAPVPSYEEWKSAYECQLMESELVLTLKGLLKRAKDILEDEGDYMIVQQIDEVLK